MSKSVLSFLGGGKGLWVVAGLGLAAGLALWSLMREKPAEMPPSPVVVEAPAMVPDPVPPPPVFKSIPDDEVVSFEADGDDVDEEIDETAWEMDDEAEDVPEDWADEEGTDWVEDGPIIEEPQTPLEPGEFLAAVRSAIATNMDPVEVQEILARVPLDPELLEQLVALADDPASGPEMQGYAAEALVRAGTPEAMQYVLDELLSAYQTGDDERGDRMVAALEAPTTPEGLQMYFDLLLKRGAYADLQGELPPEVLSAARNALLSSPDPEIVGDMAADLYLDPEVMANESAMWELFDGVSHPLMLSQLVARAYEENLPDNAAKIMERLGQSDEQGVVQAVVDLALNPSVPVDEAAEALFKWSAAHPGDAMPGLFLEYMTDSTLTPDQRTIAAYGLGGITDPEYAKEALQALKKAMANETDPAVLMDLQTALSLLEKQPE